MKKYLFLTILSLIAFAPLSAQKFSVAYVDMQYILKNLPQYETANEQLNMISKRWQKDIDAILPQKPDIIMLPKTSCANDVLTVEDVILIQEDFRKVK